MTTGFQNYDLASALSGLQPQSLEAKEANLLFKSHRCVCLEQSLSLPEVLDIVSKRRSEFVLFTARNSPTLLVSTKELLEICSKIL